MARELKVNIEELEARYHFRYLPHNCFEDREEVYAKGMEKWQSGQVSTEVEERGSQYIAQLRSGYISPCSIRFVNDRVGCGLFAELDINPCEYIGEYTGLVRKNDRRYLEPLNHYCYEYPIQDSIDRSYVIDATEGHFTRFINHSAQPNLRPLYAFYEGFYHCIFLSLRPIRKGEQFSYDYGKSYWYIRNSPEEL